MGMLIGALLFLLGVWVGYRMRLPEELVVTTVSVNTIKTNRMEIVPREKRS